MARLAMLRHDGLDSPADLAEAAVWFRRAAELGNGDAQTMVAHLYADGRGVERNPVEALIWSTQAAGANGEAAALRERLVREMPAAAQGESHYRLAMMIQAREEAARDDAAMTENFRLAGELGHPQAMRRVALCYFDGIGIARDWTAAAGWLLRAAEAGSLESGLAYAAMVFAGEGVPRDPTAALPWARRAAEAGLEGAQHLLASIERALAASASDPLTPSLAAGDIPRELPLAVPQDPAGAASVLAPGDLFDETAPPKVPEPVIQADPRDAMGQTALGLDYYFGRNGRPRDLTTAAKWLQRAANGGSLAAQHNLSVMFAHGQGLRVDPVEGARWCRMAAERGDQRSQFRMSSLYFHGQGVGQDMVEALYWAELAARQGHRGALTARDGLVARMTPQQIAEVRHRAESFQRKT